MNFFLSLPSPIFGWPSPIISLFSSWFSFLLLPLLPLIPPARAASNRHRLPLHSRRPPLPSFHPHLVSSLASTLFTSMAIKPCLGARLANVFPSLLFVFISPFGAPATMTGFASYLALSNVLNFHFGLGRGPLSPQTSSVLSPLHRWP